MFGFAVHIFENSFSGGALDGVVLTAPGEHNQAITKR